MNVHLGEHFDALIRKQVESGRYANASEVVREGLRLLEAQEIMETLLAAVDVAEAEVARGETVPYTPELMERLKREAAANARAGKPIDSDLIT